MGKRVARPFSDGGRNGRVSVRFGAVIAAEW